MERHKNVRRKCAQIKPGRSPPEALPHQLRIALPAPRSLSELSISQTYPNF
jgi:hypothetical protein